MTNTQLRRMTSVAIPQNTVILEITAGSTDPAFAAEVANAIATELSEAMTELAPVEEGGNATIVARVIEPAVPATVQSSPNKQRDALLGAFAGALLAGLGIALWALLDTRVRSVDVLRRLTDLPLLGAVPERRSSARAPVLIQEPNGASAEAYRGVRSSLRFAAVEHSINSLAVTSSLAGRRQDHDRGEPGAQLRRGRTPCHPRRRRSSASPGRGHARAGECDRADHDARGLSHPG